MLPLEDIRAAVKDAGEAFEVLTVHFVKEETVIYPMVRASAECERQRTVKPAIEYAHYVRMNRLLLLGAAFLGLIKRVDKVLCFICDRSE